MECLAAINPQRSIKLGGGYFSPGFVPENLEFD
jgi:hypothetical protein